MEVLVAEVVAVRVSVDLTVVGVLTSVLLALLCDEFGVDGSWRFWGGEGVRSRPLEIWTSIEATPVAAPSTVDELPVGSVRVAGMAECRFSFVLVSFDFLLLIEAGPWTAASRCLGVFLLVDVGEVG